MNLYPNSHGQRLLELYLCNFTLTENITMSIKTLSLAAAIALSLGLSTSVWAADDATPPPVAGATTDAAKGADTAADASKAAEGDDAKKECIPKAETDVPAAEGEAKDAEKPTEAPADATTDTPADADAAKGGDDVKLPPCDENGKAPKVEEGDTAATGDAPAEVPATDK
jgi:hypothetical protein